MNTEYLGIIFWVIAIALTATMLIVNNLTFHLIGAALGATAAITGVILVLIHRRKTTNKEGTEQ